MSSNIVYIHGANASRASFNYIKQNIHEHIALDIEYSVDIPFRVNEQEFKQLITDTFADEPFSLICHSMGGLFGARILNVMHNAEKAVTISTPFGGSKFVDYLRLLRPTYQLFKDIRITSSVIRGFKTFETTKPILSLVSTGGGNPLMGERNDGTVTFASQKAVSGVTFEHLPYNHFEILLAESTASTIKNFLT